MKQTFSLPNNPTDKERYDMTLKSLKEAGRLEDFDNIMSLLSSPEDITNIAPPGSFKGIKVGVIGGGLAGLSTAFELRKLGFDITIFEAEKDRIGGRVYTYYFDKEKTLYGEFGPMRIPASHEATWHYINLFNLNTKPFIQYNPNGLIYAKNIRLRNDPNGMNVMEKIYPKFNLTKVEKRTPWMDLLDYAFETPLYLMTPEIRKQLAEIRKKYSSEILFWDFQSTRRTLELSSLSEAAIMMLSSITSFGSSIFDRNIIEILIQSYTLSFENLYKIPGGFSKLPYAFYNSLINKKPNEYGTIDYNMLGNINFKSGTYVNGIYYFGKNKVVLQFRDKNKSENEKQEFDYVVCAIPFSTLRNIDIYPQFSNEKMQAIKEMSYASAQKTILLCETRFWEKGSPSERILGGASFTDLVIQSIWYPSNFKEGKQKGVLLASYNFIPDAVRLGNLPIEMRINNVKNQIAQVHGISKEYLDKIVTDSDSINWDANPWSLGGFCYYTPEQKRLFSYTVTKPEYNNKIFFAGEHISQLHAWINGSFETGMKAANDISKMALFAGRGLNPL